ncbi:hypothetical protein HAX54_047686, partial [Datura stramonium]|nr:hypothetical protein [Datura stramonium]
MGGNSRDATLCLLSTLSHDVYSMLLERQPKYAGELEWWRKLTQIEEGKFNLQGMVGKSRSRPHLQEADNPSFYRLNEDWIGF